MKVSARNQLRGVVSEIKLGAVNAEVTLDMNGTSLVAIITNESVQSLGLAIGVEAFALIKASFVILTTGDGGLKTSARNRLCGTIERINAGAVNTEVVLELNGGAHLAAVVTNESVETLGLTQGGRACALDQGPACHPGRQRLIRPLARIPFVLAPGVVSRSTHRLGSLFLNGN